MPVPMKARICGHHASMVLARVVTSGTSARAHQSQNANSRLLISGRAAPVRASDSR